MDWIVAWSAMDPFLNDRGEWRKSGANFSGIALPLDGPPPHISIGRVAFGDQVPSNDGHRVDQDQDWSAESHDDVPAAPSGRSGQAEETETMNFEKYTERARGFVQSAQSLA